MQDRIKAQSLFKKRKKARRVHQNTQTNPIRFFIFWENQEKTKP